MYLPWKQSVMVKKAQPKFEWSIGCETGVWVRPSHYRRERFQNQGNQGTHFSHPFSSRKSQVAALRELEIPHGF